jgi:hypothetical protein
MLFLNAFRDGGSLRETTPQGDSSMPVKLPADAEAAIVAYGPS